MPTLMMAFTYTWAQDNVNQLVTFYFLSIRSVYLPVLMLLLALLLEGTQGALQLGVGYASAHCYLYFNTLLPLTGGKRLIHTPKFLYNIIPGKPAVKMGSPGGREGGRDFGTTFNTGGSGRNTRQSSSSSSGSSGSSSSSYGFTSSFNRFQGKGHRLGT